MSNIDLSLTVNGRVKVLKVLGNMRPNSETFDAFDEVLKIIKHSVRCRDYVILSDGYSTVISL